MTDIKKNWLLIIFSLFLFIEIDAQDVKAESSFIRNSDAINFRTDIFIRKISLYQPVASITGYDRWDSPFLNYYVNGYKKEIFPLNFRSVDLLSSGINSVENYEINQPGIDNLSGHINLSSYKIPDSLQLKVHLFLGGETGDPMHQVFTNSSTVNRNKILPSGELSLSNKTESFSYRFSGGFYGYFTQQDKNSGLTNLVNPDEFSDPNKNFTASGEFNYKFDNNDVLDFYASGYKFSGFDVTPAFPLMIFMNSTNLSFYSSYYNNNTGLLFKLKAEDLTAGIEESPFNDEYEYKVRKIVLSTEKKIDLSKWHLKFKADVSHLSTENEVSRLLAEETDKTEFGLTADVDYKLNEKFKIFFNGSVNEGLTGGYANAAGGIGYDGLNHKIDFTMLSGEEVPDLFALYGDMQVKDKAQIIPEESFRGNRELENEKVLRFSLNYNYANEKLFISLTPAYNYIDDVIKWKKDNLTVSRINGDEIDFFSFNSRIKYQIGEDFGVNLGYKYNENVEGIYKPEQKFSLQYYHNFAFDASLIFEGYYQSDVDWNSFKEFVPVFVKEINYDSDIASFFIFNLTWKQKMPVIFGVQNIEFAVRCENIFDKKVKYLPMSCEFPRNFTVNLFFTL